MRERKKPSSGLFSTAGGRVMAKSLFLMALVVVSQIISFRQPAPGQTNTSTEARLVGSFSKGDFIHAAQDAAIALTAFAGKPGDRIAVRICSRESMPLALATASGRPFYLAEFLTENYKYPRENIIFMRSEECQAADLSIAMTEFWAVPTGAPLPHSVESIKASEVSAEELPLADDETDPARFNQALQALVTRLRSRPRATGVIIGYYLKHPSTDLKNNLREASRLLARSGLSGDRYFVRSMPWTGMVDVTDSETKYPGVIVIEVAKECK